MTGKHGAAEHHSSAAIRRERAALHRHQVLRQYQVGKDSAFAARQALVVHLPNFRDWRWAT